MSTYADTISGNFMIRGLFEGSYILAFQPVHEYKDTLLSGIDVLPGQAMVVDTVFIQ